MSNEHNFKVGDKVYHRATEQPMIVEKVVGEDITCSFGSKNIYKKERFKATTLTSSLPKKNLLTLE